MTERNAVHGSFVIERVYKASPERVFMAWADPEAKAKWFAGPAEMWAELERKFDFRIGGRDRSVGKFKNGPTSVFDSYYWDIVPNRRIIYAYEMHLDDRKISVSLATVEFQPEGTGTRLVVTEQGVFVDGYEDNGSRAQGTALLMDALGRSLET